MSVSLDPFAIQHGQRCPQRELWAAVLEQALADVFTVPSGCSHRAERVKTRNEAIALLTDASGEWARQRAMICGLIDSDPDAIRSRVLQRMALTPPPEIPYAPAKRVEPPSEQQLARQRERNAKREAKSEKARFLWLMQYLERTAAMALELPEAV